METEILCMSSLPAAGECFTRNLIVCVVGWASMTLFWHVQRRRLALDSRKPSHCQGQAYTRKLITRSSRLRVSILCSFILSTLCCHAQDVGPVSVADAGSAPATSRALSMTNSEVLSTLYVATTGTSWTVKTNWLSGFACPGGGWYGVTCDGSDVVELFLSGNNLQGTLPTQLGQLTAMTTNLAFTSNTLTGSIPSELGQLSALHSYFGFYRNSLSGSVPSQFGQLSRMTEKFYLYSNQLSGSSPSELGLLTGMTSNFHLRNNKLTSPIPSEFGQLTLMDYYISWSDNSFTGSIPSELGQLTGMTYYFYLQSNQLSGSVPSELGLLTRMSESFNLWGSKLSSSIPSEIGQLSLMTSRYGMSENSLTGSIPSEFGLLSALTYGLWFEYNSLSGTIPSELGRMTSLTSYFFFTANELSGSIPSQLGLLKLTSYFGLDFNNLCDTVPIEVSVLSSGVSGWALNGNSLGTPCCVTLPASYNCSPTSSPTLLPTHSPSIVPSLSPTNAPSQVPTYVPTLPPTPNPTFVPTYSPTVVCLPGYSFDGSRTCTACPSGRYTNFTGTPYPQACELCPSGRYNVIDGSVGCLQCANGKLSSADRTQCTDCKAGEYSLNASECVECASGYYAPQALSDSCITCPAGSHTNKNVAATTCTACDAGKYSSRLSVNCSSCDLGRFSGSGASQCSECAKGFIASNAGSSTCTACPVGRIAASTSSSNCTACSTGRYQGSTGQSECTPCSAGEISDRTGLSTCTACSAGKIAATVSSSNCSDCPKGRYQGSTGQDRCDACESGKYASSIGTTSCLSCEGGKYSNVNTSFSSCWSCMTGTYSNSGASSCLPCTLGFISARAGSSTCTACTAGRIAANASSSNCTDCPIGRYQGATGQSKCIDCKAGEYAATTGRTSCISCRASQNSLTGSSSCDLAADDYYLVLPGSISTVCPYHATCSGGIWAPVPSSGYWVDHQANSYAGNLFKCARATCKGGDTNASSCWNVYQYNETKCLDGSLQCFEGSEGPLCGSCMTGYIYRSATNDCESCEQATLFSYTASIVGIGLALGLFVFFRLYKPNKETTMNFLLYIDGGTLKVIWVTYQIVASSSFTLNVTYPYPFGNFLGLMSVFSLDFLALECVSKEGNNVYATVYLWCTLPIIVLAVIFFIGGVRWLLHYAQHEVRTLVIDQHIWLFLFFTYLVLPSVSSKQLQVLDCIPLNGDDRYLRIDTSVDCDSDSYLEFRFVILLFIILYQMIPVLWFLLLHSNKDALNPPGSKLDPRLAMYVRDNNAALRPLRFLFTHYTCSKWWFEIADMYRRITFIGILPLISTKATVRASFGCILAVASVIVFRELLPYKVKFANSVAHFAQYSILVTYYFALSINSGSMVNFGLEGKTLGSFLICFNLMVVILSCFFAWRAHKHHVKLQSDKEWKASQYEYAIGFSEGKFKTTLDSIRLNDIPNSNALVFHYTTFELAKTARKSGIFADERYKGIPFSLRRPYATTVADDLAFSRFISKETHSEQEKAKEFPSQSVLVLSLPKKLLIPLPGFDNDIGLCMLSVDVLHAMRPTSFAHVVDSGPWLDGYAMLPPTAVLRSFYISQQDPMPEKNAARRSTTNDMFISDISFPLLKTVQPLKSISQYLNSLSRIRADCMKKGLVPLYHYTSPSVAHLILRSGLRMSTQGQGDGGVYVSTLGPASYGLGSKEYEVNIIKDCFGPERIDEYKGKGKLDIILVYACNASVLDQTPGGRVNARMFSKSSFRYFSMENAERNQFLRPDRIMAAFQYLPDHDLIDRRASPDEWAHSAREVAQEAQIDKDLVKILRRADEQGNENLNRIDKAILNLNTAEMKQVKPSPDIVAKRPYAISSSLNGNHSTTDDASVTVAEEGGLRSGIVSTGADIIPIVAKLNSIQRVPKDSSEKITATEKSLWIGTDI